MPPFKPIVKRPRLTLAQLASYDDILTDALVDQVYFWTKVRKNRSKYSPTRGISEDDVTRILLHEVVCNKDAAEAERQLLRLPGIRKFVDRLATQRETDDFKRHLRKYINIWLPDCPWEVSTVNRYTLVTHEAATTARRAIKKGETVKYLTGNLVAMTAQEENDLDLTRRDFSIVMSSRKRTPSLFLGPARFANHDCDANARLVTTGAGGMQVVAVRQIAAGEEITVTYGEDYFGIDNCECLCYTCELKLRNGWAPAAGALADASAVQNRAGQEGPGEAYPLRNKRRHDQLGGPSSASMTPDVDIGSMRKRRKRNTLGTALGSASTPGHTPLEAVESATEETQQNEPPMLSATDQLSDRLLALAGDGPLNSPPATADGEHAGTRASLARQPCKSAVDPAHSSLETSDVESVFDEIDPLKASTPASCSSGGGGSTEAGTARDIKAEEQEPDVLVTVSVHNEVEAERSHAEATTAETKAKEANSDSELSDLGNWEVDDVTMTVQPKPKPKRKYRKRGLAANHPIASVETALVRRPGDYVRKAALLSEPYSRWVDCGTCGGCWVQANGYCTRKECPRCERHSKLYGYQWPKTEQLRGDEPRVMDHRTVHRFLHYEEEARIRKRNKGLSVQPGDGEEEGVAAAATAAAVTVSGAESDDAGPVHYGSRRRRRTTTTTTSSRGK